MRRVDETTLLFFDASCLIAAAASPAGGSGFLWSLCERGFFRAAVSQAVLAEAEANLFKKFDPVVLARHRMQLATCGPTMAPLPHHDESLLRFPDINPKDVHVVAAAQAIDADFILTLDQPLAIEIAAKARSVAVRSPGAFIRHELPTHPSFPVLRND